MGECGIVKRALPAPLGQIGPDSETSESAPPFTPQVNPNPGYKCVRIVCPLFEQEVSGEQ